MLGETSHNDGRKLSIETGFRMTHPTRSSPHVGRRAEGGREFRDVERYLNLNETSGLRALEGLIATKVFDCGGLAQVTCAPTQIGK